MNKKNYQPKPVTQDLIDGYQKGKYSLWNIAQLLKRDQMSVRNEMIQMGVQIRLRGSKRSQTKNAAGEPSKPTT